MVCTVVTLTNNRPNLISFHLVVPGTVHLLVQGDGLLSDVYRVLIKALDPASHANITVDTTKCLPAANPPDLFSYYQIGEFLMYQGVFSRYGHVRSYVPDRLVQTGCL